ncbi:Nucleolar transcription factor 1-B [Mizuhopecten yessoensis]|uniref:Nucleolar transcription factor 1-B n=1 Tax=Mizuhopecten yessoensis TaxID=6573 RepID=A0A210QKA2_MIZYE|nr:Nucleolar transcription factor 1-B [Mizuhopecten yessoensis]
MASKSSTAKSAKKRKHTSVETDNPVDMEDCQPKKKKSKKKKGKKDADKTLGSSSDVESAPVQKLFNSHDDSEIWSNDEVKQLLDKVQEMYPANLKGHDVSYRRSMTKINWDTIMVEPHSPAQCKAKFTDLLQKVNSLRTLPEMITAARKVKQAALYVGVKPKLPPSVFMLYCQDYRERHKGTHIQGIDLGKGYRSLSEKKKKKFESQYEEQRVQYEKQMAEFKLKNPDMYPVKTYTLRKVADKVPKVVYPLTLYVDHLMEKALAENKDADRTEIRNHGKVKFASLKPKKQQKWLEEAVLANKDLEARVKIYLEKNPENKVNSVVLMRNAQRILEKARGKPEKPQSAFKIFSQQNASQLTHLTTQLQRKQNMEQWKALSLSERVEYEKQALQDKMDYEKKYRLYVQNLSADERAELEKKKEQNKKNAVKSTELYQKRVTELDFSPNGDHHDSDDEMSDVIPDTQVPTKIILNSAKKNATKWSPTSSPDQEQMTKIKSPKKSSPSKSKKPVLPSPSTSDSLSEDDKEQSPSPTKPSVSKKVVPSPKKVVPSPKKAVPSPKKAQKRKASSSSSSTSSDSSEEETVAQPPKKTKIVAKRKSTSSSSSSSSDSENEVLTQKPVAKHGKKGTPSVPVTKEASSPVKTKSPVKTPAAAKPDSSSSDSSDSGSSSSDSEPEKTVKKSPAAQKSPFTTSAVKKVVSQSESSSDSDSDSELDT